MENILKYDDFLHSRDERFNTLIMAGYDLKTDDRGISYLGEEVIRRQHNKVVVGGAVNLLKHMFGATTELSTDTLNKLMNIGLDATALPNETPSVCLFNIGIGGCGASYADKKVTLDQENVVKQIVPFRIVDTPTDINEENKYFFHKVMENGKHAYYLKAFESTPTIHSLFKDGIDGNDGTELVGNPASYDRTDGVETFVEIILRITAQDLREYFAIYDDPDYPRFNTIGLCMAKKGKTPDGATEYVDVNQFSVLNFSNEMLHFDKDLSIIYRVYMS